MGKIVSTGQITLTNLIETATYVYYSANSNGANPTIQPVLEGKGLSKYMGIYNGPAIRYGQPDPRDPEQLDEYNSIKDQIKWSSYIGPQDANQKYEIRSNSEEIIKFIDREQYVFSPEEIEFYVFDKENKEIITSPSFRIDVIYINNDIRETLEVTSYFYLDNKGKIKLNIKNFLKENEEKENSEWNKTILYRLFKNGEGYLNFNVQEKQQPILSKILRVRFGTTEEMAKFNITATSINAAIRDSIMQFTEQGLDIYNGGLKIHKKKENKIETVLWMDEESGNLTIHGDIYAANGEFNGIIKAKGGYFENELSILGDLTVGQFNKIYIGEKGQYQGIFSSNYSANGDEGFFITPEGRIFANEITLGKGAKIQDFLQIGEHCFLQNPTKENGQSVISIYDNYDNNIFNIAEDGKLKLGTDENGIIADGEKSSIGSTNYSKGAQGWFLSNEEAELNNVIIRGVVKDTVFAHGEVQTVGGILIVRPTFLIDKAYKYPGEDLYVVTTKMDGAGISVGDYCQIGNRAENEYFQIVYIERQNKNLKLEDCYYLRPLSSQNQIIDGENIDVPQCSDSLAKLSYDNNNAIIVSKNNNNGNVKLKNKEVEIGTNGEARISNILYLSRKQGFEEVGIPPKQEDFIFKLKNKMIAGFYEQNFTEDLKKNWSGLPLLTLATPKKDKDNKSYIDNNVGIAINSSEGSNYAPSSISVFTQDLVTKNGKQSFVRNDRIVLGDLGKEATKYGGLTGYGLYAENVYLKGQLISESPVKITPDSKKFYSGINTASDVDMIAATDKNIYFPGQETGKILFWSGAKNLDDIQNSPFKVDSYGNLFASSGYFKGTIITEASITASTLRTATIEGYKMNGAPGTENDPALTIRNTDNYIRFVSGDKPENSVTRMEFSNKNIRATMPIIISASNVVDKDSIVLGTDGSINTQNIVLRNKESYEKIKISSNGIIFGKTSKQEEKGEKYEIDNTNYGAIKYNFDAKELQLLANDQTIFSVDQTSAISYQNFSFSKKVEFRQIKSVENNKVIGFDAYITE